MADEGIGYWRNTADTNLYTVYLGEQADEMAKFCWAMMQYWFRWHSYWVDVSNLYAKE
jgi:hypothetical protein